jgi:dihydrofolate reductase
VSEPRARSRIELVLVAAVADNGVIGRGGTLPWRLKSDMRHFRAITWGKPVVVGRATFLSFTTKPLPGRTNIVLSRDDSFATPVAVVSSSVEPPLRVARGDALRRAVGAIMVVGGADIYAQTIAIADRLLITRVHLQPQGDAKFPAIDPDAWRETDRSEHRPGPDDETSFTTLVYERRTGGVASAQATH